MYVTCVIFSVLTVNQAKERECHQENGRKEDVHVRYRIVLTRRNLCVRGPVSPNPCRSQVSCTSIYALHVWHSHGLCEFHFRVRKDTERRAGCKGALCGFHGPRREVFASQFGFPTLSLHPRKEQHCRPHGDHRFRGGEGTRPGTCFHR